MDNIISVGKILNFHGILGAAKVGYSNIEVIKNLKTVYMAPLGATGGSREKFSVQNIKFHKNFAIIKFKEINSIDELLPYKGTNICINKTEAEDALSDDEFLIEDLLGLNVFDNNDEYIGVITDVKGTLGNDILCVQCAKNGIYAKTVKASDDVGLKNDTHEILIPFAKELVPVVDIKKKKVVIKPIEGLL